MLPAFVVAVVIISATPGPAMALLIQRTALRGPRYGIAVVVGLELGLYTWALLVASGVALVAASEIGFVVLKVIGCVVLAWLAWKSFSAWKRMRHEPVPATPPAVSDAPPLGRLPLLRATVQGFIVQLANPKAAIFLLALYPQFVPADRPLFATTAALGLLQVAIESLIYLAIVLGVARAGAWFRKSVVRRRLEAITGTVMVLLGVRLALSER